MLYSSYHILFYRVISGERVVGRGSDLYQLCKDIDDTIKGIIISEESSDIEDWSYDIENSALRPRNKLHFKIY